MRPNDLKPPFKGKEKSDLFQDGVLFVPPTREVNTSFLGWKGEELFKKEQSIALEYCSGNGDWIVNRALEHPEFNWVAVEMKFERVRKIWSKMKNHGIDNVLIICGEALNVTKKYFAEDTVQQIFVNFPDPWPKLRHAKNRLFQMPFIQECARILQCGGSFTAVTDDARYSQQMINVLLKAEQFISKVEAPYYTTTVSTYGTSYFESVWRAQGKDIRYHFFEKQCS